MLFFFKYWTIWIKDNFFLFYFRRLDGNPLICDCKLKWFIEYAKKETASMHLAASCANPQELEKRHIKSLSNGDIKCGKILLPAEIFYDFKSYISIRK